MRSKGASQSNIILNNTIGLIISKLKIITDIFSRKFYDNLRNAGCRINVSHLDLVFK